MKTLFAVSNENVSNKIVDSFRKRYGNTLSFKNVFYFNAIIKEIQKDKTYDRIVISEDLEPFANNNYDVIDKFILQRLKEVAEYGINESGNKIDIIVICTDRRTKSSFVLKKMYELGIYNALIGSDRRIDNVCNLLQEPRTAEEAREYYNIENESTDIPAIDDVTEQEVQNILIHYKKLGKNENRYADSFNNIAAQYTDKQLKIIIKCLPINVRAVLEAECPKYQELVTSDDETEQEKKLKEKIQEQRRIEQFEQEKKLKNKIAKEKKEAMRTTHSISTSAQMEDTRSGIDLLDNKKKQSRLTGNVVVPNNMNIRSERKLYSEEEQSSQNNNIRKPQQDSDSIYENQQTQNTYVNNNGITEFPGVEENKNIASNQFDNIFDNENISTEQDITTNTTNSFDSIVPETNNSIQQTVNNEENQIANTEPVKRGRGRPRKNPIEPPKPKGKRGRPRKNPLPEENQIVEQTTENELPAQVSESTNTSTNTLPGFDNFDNNLEQPTTESNTLPGFDNFDNSIGQSTTEPNTLPGFEDFDNNIEQSATESNTLPGFDNFDNNLEQPATESNTLPGFDNFDNNIEQPITESSTLPGFDDFNNTTGNQTSETNTLPGFDEIQTNNELLENNISENPLDDLMGDLINDKYNNDDNAIKTEQIQNNSIDNGAVLPGLMNGIENKNDNYNIRQQTDEKLNNIENTKNYQTGNLNAVLAKDKKIVAFVGASKNGTSFLVNNLACLFSSIGVKTAILDMTQNKNSYYIYTNNDENLRNIAYTCIEKLENGTAEGIKVDRNLDVYTTIPNDGKDYSNAESILSTLVQNYSLVLIDCDFNTDLGYFANAQEIYLVQSMDILTIQPLTAFLRELKTQNILDQEKLRVIVNKELKVKSLSTKAVIGGMAFYNDPSMSYMTELFNKDKIKACTIPFDEAVYSKYLEAMVNCNVSINGYTKNFMNSLKILGNMVYPLLSKQTYEYKQSPEANYGTGQ